MKSFRLYLARGSLIALVIGESSVSAPSLRGQSASLADLRWSATETTAGRFTIVPGRRAFVAGYNSPGLEVWMPPLQLLRDYSITVRVAGDTSETDGRTALRNVEQTPMRTTRVYSGTGFVVRERIFTPVDVPAATIGYVVESSKPVEIT